MKTSLVTSVALAAAVAILPSSGSTLAQDAKQSAGVQQSTQGLKNDVQSWENPDRIADIQDESERIRAFSVLIGQSVYDQMLKADAASSSGGADTTETDGATATSGAAGSADTMQDNQANHAASSLEAVTINILNVADIMNPDDVWALEQLAEQNEQQLVSLQSAINQNEKMRSALEEEGLIPADVVGIQRTSSVLDMFVIPDWLNE